MQATKYVTREGVTRRVEVLVDRWGIPHIYAGNEHDLYFAQGFTAARFRLWQMDLWRKRGLGLLAASFGDAYVEQDTLRRLFLYRGDMAAEWAAYGPGVKDITEAFVAGINAYVRLARQRRAPLPPEFAWTGTAPALWGAGDVVRVRSVGLRMNPVDEVVRCRLAELGRLDLDNVRRYRDPGRPLAVPEGLDPAAVPDEVARRYALALAEPGFSAPPPPAAGPAPGPQAEASNVWAIAPRRSATGRALFANDPHRNHSVPSLRWLVHLCAPSIEVAGATEPVHPGVSNGHNQRLAFGFTYSPCDQEDLFVCRLDPEDADRYRGAGAWERLQLVEEEVPVLGAAPRKVTLAFTRHGPVLYRDAATGRCVALRSAFLEPGGAPYYAGVSYHRARDVPDFRARLERAVAPTMNYCGADVDGGIGLFVRGRVPVRTGWDGLMPVPADGPYDWAGFVAPDDLPSVQDPPSGWVASCNQRPLPDDYPFDARRIGFEFSDPSRFRRLTALVAGRPAVSIDDCRAFQMDQTLDMPARLLPGVLAHCPDLPAVLRRALEAWDGAMTADSAPAAFFAVWTERHLRRRLVERLVPGAARPLVGNGDWRGLLAAPVPAEVVQETVQAALAELAAVLGTDPGRWRLGDVQTMTIAHPLSAVVPEARDGDIAAIPVGGHTNTLNKADSAGPDLAVKHGASFRLVMDVGNWRDTLAVNMPGQSGDPRDPHYKDLLEAWRTGDYVPLLWDRADVEDAAAERLVLEPEPGAPRR